MEQLTLVISTHAPRTGSDLGGLDCFLLLLGISTHAPRTGSDICIVFSFRQYGHFNPRSPHGERRRV